MAITLFRSRRFEFWAAFLLISAVCFAFAIAGRVRRQNAGRTAEILLSLISTDPRFTRVTVSCGTNGRTYLNGLVNSAEDLIALYAAVRGAKLPSRPIIVVHFPVPARDESRPTNTSPPSGAESP